jgi:hypothetical protein
LAFAFAVKFGQLKKEKLTTVTKAIDHIYKDLPLSRACSFRNTLVLTLCLLGPFIEKTLLNSYGYRRRCIINKLAGKVWASHQRQQEKRAQEVCCRCLIPDS